MLLHTGVHLLQGDADALVQHKDDPSDGGQGQVVVHMGIEGQSSRGVLLQERKGAPGSADGWTWGGWVGEGGTKGCQDCTGVHKGGGGVRDMQRLGCVYNVPSPV